MRPEDIALAVGIASLTIAFIALAFSIKAFRRARSIALQCQSRSDYGDPTAFTIVTDGKHYRVRGPFDTFYTMKLHDREEAVRFAAQLASWYRHLEEEREAKWRQAA